MPRKGARKGLCPKRCTSIPAHGPSPNLWEVCGMEDCEENVLKPNEGGYVPQGNSSASTFCGDTFVVHAPSTRVAVSNTKKSGGKKSEPAGCQIGENCIQENSPNSQKSRKDSIHCDEEVTRKSTSQQARGSYSLNYLLNPCTRTEIGSGDLYHAWQQQDIQSRECFQVINATPPDHLSTSSMQEEYGQEEDNDQNYFTEPKATGKFLFDM